MSVCSQLVIKISRHSGFVFPLLFLILDLMYSSLLCAFLCAFPSGLQSPVYPAFVAFIGFLVGKQYIQEQQTDFLRWWKIFVWMTPATRIKIYSLVNRVSYWSQETAMFQNRKQNCPEQRKNHETSTWMTKWRRKSIQNILVMARKVAARFVQCCADTETAIDTYIYIYNKT